jgi:hypothetical protein
MRREQEVFDTGSLRRKRQCRWMCCNWLGRALTSAGRYDEAAGHCEKLPADDPGKSECLGRARLGQGKFGEAIQVLATVNNRGYLGYAYARAGRRRQPAVALSAKASRIPAAADSAGDENSSRHDAPIWRGCGTK